MLVDKEKLKKKMLKEFDDYYGKHQCSICRKIIEKEDIENLNFEYVKNKLR